MSRLDALVEAPPRQSSHEGRRAAPASRVATPVHDRRRSSPPDLSEERIARGAWDARCSPRGLHHPFLGSGFRPLTYDYPNTGRLRPGTNSCAPRGLPPSPTPGRYFLLSRQITQSRQHGAKRPGGACGDETLDGPARPRAPRATRDSPAGAPTPPLPFSLRGVPPLPRRFQIGILSGRSLSTKILAISVSCDTLTTHRAQNAGTEHAPAPHATPRGDGYHGPVTRREDDYDPAFLEAISGSPNITFLTLRPTSPLDGAAVEADITLLYAILRKDRDLRGLLEILPEDVNPPPGGGNAPTLCIRIVSDEPADLAPIFSRLEGNRVKISDNTYTATTDRYTVMQVSATGGDRSAAAQVCTQPFIARMMAGEFGRDHRLHGILPAVVTVGEAFAGVLAQGVTVPPTFKGFTNSRNAFLADRESMKERNRKGLPIPALAIFPPANCLRATRPTYIHFSDRQIRPCVNCKGRSHISRFHSPDAGVILANGEWAMITPEGSDVARYMTVCEYNARASHRTDRSPPTPNPNERPPDRAPAPGGGRHRLGLSAEQVDLALALGALIMSGPRTGPIAAGTQTPDLASRIVDDLTSLSRGGQTGGSGILAPLSSCVDALSAAHWISLKAEKTHKVLIIDLVTAIKVHKDLPPKDKLPDDVYGPCRAYVSVLAKILDGLREPPSDASGFDSVATIVVDAVAATWAAHGLADEGLDPDASVPFLRDRVLTEWFEGLTPSSFLGPLHTSVRNEGAFPPNSVYAAIVELDRPMLHLLGKEATMNKVHALLESDDFVAAAASSGLDNKSGCIAATVVQLMSTALANEAREAKLTKVSIECEDHAIPMTDRGSPHPSTLHRCVRSSGNASALPPTTTNALGEPVASGTPKAWISASPRVANVASRSPTMTTSRACLTRGPRHPPRRNRTDRDPRGHDAGNGPPGAAQPRAPYPSPLAVADTLKDSHGPRGSQPRHEYTPCGLFVNDFTFPHPLTRIEQPSLLRPGGTSRSSGERPAPPNVYNPSLPEQSPLPSSPEYRLRRAPGTRQGLSPVVRPSMHARILSLSPSHRLSHLTGYPLVVHVATAIPPRASGYRAPPGRPAHTPLDPRGPARHTGTRLMGGSRGTAGPEGCCAPLVQTLIPHRLATHEVTGKRESAPAGRARTTVEEEGMLPHVSVVELDPVGEPPLLLPEPYGGRKRAGFAALHGMVHDHTSRQASSLSLDFRLGPPGLNHATQLRKPPPPHRGIEGGDPLQIPPALLIPPHLRDPRPEGVSREHRGCPPLPGPLAGGAKRLTSDPVYPKPGSRPLPIPVTRTVTLGTKRPGYAPPARMLFACHQACDSPSHRGGRRPPGVPQHPPRVSLANPRPPHVEHVDGQPVQLGGSPGEEFYDDLPPILRQAGESRPSPGPGDHAGEPPHGRREIGILEMDPEPLVSRIGPRLAVAQQHGFQVRRRRPCHNVHTPAAVGVVTGGICTVLPSGIPVGQHANQAPQEAPGISPLVPVRSEDPRRVLQHQHRWARPLTEQPQELRQGSSFWVTQPVPPPPVEYPYGAVPRAREAAASDVGALEPLEFAHLGPKAGSARPMGQHPLRALVVLHEEYRLPSPLAEPASKDGDTREDLPEGESILAPRSLRLADERLPRAGFGAFRDAGANPVVRGGAGVCCSHSVGHASCGARPSLSPVLNPLSVAEITENAPDPGNGRPPSPLPAGYLPSPVDPPPSLARCDGAARYLARRPRLRGASPALGHPTRAGSAPPSDSAPATDASSSDEDDRLAGLYHERQRRDSNFCWIHAVNMALGWNALTMEDDDFADNVRSIVEGWLTAQGRPEDYDHSGHLDHEALDHLGLSLGLFRVAPIDHPLWVEGEADWNRVVEALDAHDGVGSIIALVDTGRGGRHAIALSAIPPRDDVDGRAQGWAVQDSARASPWEATADRWTASRLRVHGLFEVHSLSRRCGAPPESWDHLGCTRWDLALEGTRCVLRPTHDDDDRAERGGSLSLDVGRCPPFFFHFHADDGQDELLCRSELVDYCALDGPRELPLWPLLEGENGGDATELPRNARTAWARRRRAVATIHPAGAQEQAAPDPTPPSPILLRDEEREPPGPLVCVNKRTGEALPPWDRRCVTKVDERLHDVRVRVAPAPGAPKWSDDPDGRAPGTIYLMRDKAPPFFLLVKFDDGDEESFSRSELRDAALLEPGARWPDWDESDPLMCQQAPPPPSGGADPASVGADLGAPPTLDSQISVVTWNCQGLGLNREGVRHILAGDDGEGGGFSPPEIVILTETWTRADRHKPRWDGYTVLSTSAPLPPRGFGRNKGGVAVLISERWAHPSTIKPWTGPADVHGYLCGAVIPAARGPPLTVLAAYVPPGPNDRELAARVRAAIAAASEETDGVLMVGGDFNGALEAGDRPAGITDRDRAHRAMVDRCGFQTYRPELGRRARTCTQAREATHHTRIDDLLAGRAMRPPTSERTLTGIASSSVHDPLISGVTVQSPSCTGPPPQEPSSDTRVRYDTAAFTAQVEQRYKAHQSEDADLHLAFLEAEFILSDETAAHAGERVSRSAEVLMTALLRTQETSPLPTKPPPGRRPPNGRCLLTTPQMNEVRRCHRMARAMREAAAYLGSTPPELIDPNPPPPVEPPPTEPPSTSPPPGDYAAEARRCARGWFHRAAEIQRRASRHRSRVFGAMARSRLVTNRKAEMRRLRGGIRQRLTELCRPDGSTARTPEDVLAEATRYFGVLQTATRDVDETPPWDGDLDRTAIGPGGDRAPLLDKITDDLVGEILARTPKKRAKGADGLMGETLRCLPPRGVALVARLFRAFWSHGMPAFMKRSLTILLYKKGDARHLKNWRPIGLVSALSKAYTSTMKEVIYAYVEEHGILSAAQYGFREMRGSEQALRLLTSALEDAAVARRDIGLTYIDFSSAFNTVPHDGLVRVMGMLGIPTDAVAAVSDLYTSATTSVCIPQGHTDPIPVGTGTIQGDPLSPLLWALFMEPLLRWLAVGDRGYSYATSEVTLPSVAYADDLALLTSGRADAHRQLDKVLRFAEWSGLKVNHNKCAYTALVAGSPPPPDEHRPLQCGGTGSVPWLHADAPYKYMGVMVTATLAWTHDRADLMGKVDDEASLIVASPYSLRQKLDLLSTGVVMKGAYRLIAGGLDEPAIAAFDKRVARWARLIAGTSKSSATAAVFLDRDLGGWGVRSLQAEAAKAYSRLLLVSLRDRGPLGTITKGLVAEHLRRGQHWDRPAALGHALHPTYKPEQMPTARMLSVTSSAGWGIDMTDGGLPKKGSYLLEVLHEVDRAHDPDSREILRFRYRHALALWGAGAYTREDLTSPAGGWVRHLECPPSTPREKLDEALSALVASVQAYCPRHAPDEPAASSRGGQSSIMAGLRKMAAHDPRSFRSLPLIPVATVTPRERPRGKSRRRRPAAPEPSQGGDYYESTILGGPGRGEEGDFKVRWAPEGFVFRSEALAAATKWRRAGYPCEVEYRPDDVNSTFYDVVYEPTFVNKADLDPDLLESFWNRTESLRRDDSPAPLLPVLAGPSVPTRPPPLARTRSGGLNTVTASKHPEMDLAAPPGEYCARSQPLCGPVPTVSVHDPEGRCLAHLSAERMRLLSCWHRTEARPRALMLDVISACSYYSAGGSGKLNLRNHWRTPPDLVQAIYDSTGARTELFSSPLNAHPSSAVRFSYRKEDAAFGFRYDAFSSHWRGAAYGNPEYDASQLTRALHWGYASAANTRVPCMFVLVVPRYSRAGYTALYGRRGVHVLATLRKGFRFLPQDAWKGGHDGSTGTKFDVDIVAVYNQAGLEEYGAGLADGGPLSTFLHEQEASAVNDRNYALVKPYAPPPPLHSPSGAVPRPPLPAVTSRLPRGFLRAAPPDGERLQEVPPCLTPETDAYPPAGESRWARYEVAYTDGAKPTDGPGGSGIYFPNPEDAARGSLNVGPLPDDAGALVASGRDAAWGSFSFDGVQSAPRAELVALREAITRAADNKPLVVFTDCLSAIQLATKHWTRPHRLVLHHLLDLVQQITGAIANRRHPVVLAKVRAHTGVVGNEVADRLAVRAATRSQDGSPPEGVEAVSAPSAHPGGVGLVCKWGLVMPSAREAPDCAPPRSSTPGQPAEDEAPFHAYNARPAIRAVSDSLFEVSLLQPKSHLHRNAPKTLHRLVGPKPLDEDNPNRPRRSLCAGFWSVLPGSVRTVLKVRGEDFFAGYRAYYAGATEHPGCTLPGCQNHHDKGPTEGGCLHTLTECTHPAITAMRIARHNAVVRDIADRMLYGRHGNVESVFHDGGHSRPYDPLGTGCESGEELADDAPPEDLPAELLHSTVPPPPPADHGIPPEVADGAGGARGQGPAVRPDGTAPLEGDSPQRPDPTGGDADDRARGRPRKPVQLALDALLGGAQVDHDAPDIVAVAPGRDPDTKRVIIVEFTFCVEHAIGDRLGDKTKKYEPLVTALRRAGHQVTFLPIAVGVRGMIPESAYDTLVNGLRLEPRVATDLLRRTHRTACGYIRLICHKRRELEQYMGPGGITAKLRARDASRRGNPRRPARRGGVRGAASAA